MGSYISDERIQATRDSLFTEKKEKTAVQPELQEDKKTPHKREEVKQTS